MKKINQKGFTLVEVIVVLVILAILATIMIPSLTGYIKKANDRTLIADCRSAVMAAQTVASEQYALHGTFSAAEAKTLAEVPGSIDSVLFVAGTAEVAHLTYTHDGRSVVYCRAPESCAEHSEMYTIDGAAAGGGGGDTPVQSTSDQVADIGSTLETVFATLPSDFQSYDHIDSAALDKPDSAASELYKGLSDEQKALLDNYVWCYRTERDYGARFYLAEKEDIKDGSFTTYKCNPNATDPLARYQSSTKTTIGADGKFVFSNDWSAWRADM